MVKNYYITDFELYYGDTKLSLKTYSYDDFYYYIYGKNILYLTVQAYLDYCISFRFMDKNSITLYENKEFLHPIINYQTKIEAELSMNVYHEEILFITNYEPSEVEFNNQRNSQLTYQKKFTYYSETNDLIIGIIFTKPNFDASLKYGIIEKVLKFYSTSF